MSELSGRSIFKSDYYAPERQGVQQDVITPTEPIPELGKLIKPIADRVSAIRSVPAPDLNSLQVDNEARAALSKRWKEKYSKYTSGADVTNPQDLFTMQKNVVNMASEFKYNLENPSTLEGALALNLKREGEYQKEINDDKDMSSIGKMYAKNRTQWRYKQNGAVGANANLQPANGVNYNLYQPSEINAWKKHDIYKKTNQAADKYKANQRLLVSNAKVSKSTVDGVPGWKFYETRGTKRILREVKASEVLSDSKNLLVEDKPLMESIRREA